MSQAKVVEYDLKFDSRQRTSPKSTRKPDTHKIESLEDKNYNFTKINSISFSCKMLLLLLLQLHQRGEECLVIHCQASNEGNTKTLAVIEYIRRPSNALTALCVACVNKEEFRRIREDVTQRIMVERGKCWNIMTSCNMILNVTRQRKYVVDGMQQLKLYHNHNQDF